MLENGSFEKNILQRMTPRLNASEATPICLLSFSMT